MLMEYLASTLYHALAVDGAKRVFKVIDHAAIYLFIAGSYTPYCLVTLSESGGMYLCAFVWALAIIGMAAEAFWTFRPRWVSVVIYLIMGWCVVGFLPALVENLAPTGLWLLVAGGVCYSIGCVFYVLKKIPSCIWCSICGCSPAASCSFSRYCCSCCKHTRMAAVI